MKLDIFLIYMFGRIVFIIVGSKFFFFIVVGFVKFNVLELVFVMKNVIFDGDVDEEWEKDVYLDGDIVGIDVYEGLFGVNLVL